MSVFIQHAIRFKTTLAKLAMLLYGGFSGMRGGVQRKFARKSNACLQDASIQLRDVFSQSDPRLRHIFDKQCLCVPWNVDKQCLCAL